MGIHAKPNPGFSPYEKPYGGFCSKIRGVMVRGKRGEALRFYRDVVLSYDGDDCLFWPHSRTVNGYAQCRFDGPYRIVSRVLCEEVNGPPPEPSYHAAHSCGRGMSGCVAKKHIEWKSPSENQADRILHGTSNRGARHGKVKLTEADVREIRNILGTANRSVIGRRYGVDPATIRAIEYRKSWSWLT